MFYHFANQYLVMLFIFNLNPGVISYYKHFDVAYCVSLHWKIVLHHLGATEK